MCDKNVTGLPDNEKFVNDFVTSVTEQLVWWQTVS